MKFSTGVIIPTYNRVNHLDTCVYSLIVQTVKPDRVVIVDDGSDVDQEAIAATSRRLNEIIPCWRVRGVYHESKKMRLAQSFNLGIGVLDVDIVFILGVDFILDKRFVEFSVSLHERFYNIIPVGTTYTLCMYATGSPDDILGEYESGRLYDTCRNYDGSMICPSTSRSTLQDPKIRDVSGMCSAHSFRRKHGLFYDPRFVGWGAEDLDFYYNAVIKRVYPVLFQELIVFRRGHPKHAWQDDVDDLNNKLLRSKYNNGDVLASLRNGELREVDRQTGKSH